MSTEAEWAWFAGLFEGEGSIHIQGNKVTLRVQMTDLDVVQALDAIAPSPSGVRSGQPRQAGYKAIHRWHLCSRDAVIEVLTHIRPWLHNRRQCRVDEALEALARNRGVTRDGPPDRPFRRLPDGSSNPDYDRWRYRQQLIHRSQGKQLVK